MGDNSDNDTSDNDENDNSDKDNNDNDTSDNNDNSDNSDNDNNDGNDVDTNDDRDRVSDLSAAILGSKTETDEQFNTNSNNDASDMQYYVKITLINMWLILGLIVVVNICFYWCYCRKTQQTRGIKKGFANDSSDALGGVSEEENLA